MFFASYQPHACRSLGSARRLPCSLGAYGHTLVELSVVLAVVAVLLGLAAPSVGAFHAKMQLRSFTDSLFNSLLFTRREAIMRNVRVVMCKSGNGAQCSQAGGWQQGWIVFQDMNNNLAVDATDTVLLRQPGDPALRVTSRSTVSTYVSYTGLGVSAHPAGSFQSGTLTVCLPSLLPTDARNVVISPGGRARIEVLAPQPCDAR